MKPPSPAELREWSDYIVGLCGVRLDNSKAYLLQARLADLGTDLGCPSFSDLLAQTRRDRGGRLPKEIIERITTRETSFFRDASPFVLLQNKLIPDLIDRAESRQPGGPVPIRIWSAAASSGQEIYSIAISLRELLGNHPRYRIRLLATDISTRAIAKASRGIFDDFEMGRGLSPLLKQKYFTHTPDGWKIRDELRALVSFRQANLLENFSHLGSFDIIFCRNVAIYFEEAVKKSLFDRLAQQLAPGGSLVVGSAESVAGLCPQFTSKRHLRSIYYQLN